VQIERRNSAKAKEGPASTSNQSLKADLIDPENTVANKSK
jgi:hypothetical protein